MLGAFPLPVEVIPDGSQLCRVSWSLLVATQCGENFVTDNGNLILDVHGLEDHGTDELRRRSTNLRRRYSRYLCPSPGRRPDSGTPNGPKVMGAPDGRLGQGPLATSPAQLREKTGARGLLFFDHAIPIAD